MARGAIPASPLPPRRGVDAQRFRMPQTGPWQSLRDHLVERLALPAAQIDGMLQAGEFVDAAGDPVQPDAPFVPQSVVWAHRELPDEVEPPEGISIVHQDERIVVIDKPHDMATMPRGRHIVQSALARARELTGLPRLTPAHRLDRPTAGLVMFTTEQQWRGPYQRLFATGAVTKRYLAVAGVSDLHEFPLRRCTHIVKEHGVHQAREVPDAEPNAETLIEMVEQRGDMALYRLAPVTGRTHQLRCQLWGLGIPIENDDLYPVDRQRAVDDFTDPLQLLASDLEFLDPVDGTQRSFRTRRRLRGWPPSPI